MGYTFKAGRPPGAAGSRIRKPLLWASALLVVLLAVGLLGYVRVFRSYPPKELMQDIRAGVAARDVKDPNERFVKYLEGRYGSMEEAANRQTAFLAFFDPEHIRALQFLATHAPREQQSDNIAATARWVEQYRENLSPADRAALKGQLDSEAGRQMLRKAMAVYNSQDIYYRGSTAPVISQLLKTIEEVRGNSS